MQKKKGGYFFHQILVPWMSNVRIRFCNGLILRNYQTKLKNLKQNHQAASICCPDLKTLSISISTQIKLKVVYNYIFWKLAGNWKYRL